MSKMGDTASVALTKYRNSSPKVEAETVKYREMSSAELEKELEGALGRKISIQQGKHSGQLTLEYYGAEDLERLSEALRNLRV